MYFHCSLHAPGSFKPSSLCWCSSVTRNVLFVYSNSPCPPETTFSLQWHHLFPISYYTSSSSNVYEHLVHTKQHHARSTKMRSRLSLQTAESLVRRNTQTQLQCQCRKENHKVQRGRKEGTPKWALRGLGGGFQRDFRKEPPIGQGLRQRRRGWKGV